MHRYIRHLESKNSMLFTGFWFKGFFWG